MGMAKDLVTVAAYPSLAGAQLARSLLETEGIPAFVSDEAAAAEAGGYVELRVPEGAAPAALGILQATASAAEASSTPGPGSQERCLICQSSDFRPVELSPLLRLFRGILLRLVPLPAQWFEGRSQRCAVCGHESQSGPAEGASYG